MDFVEYDQAVFVSAEKQPRLGELSATFARLQVDVERVHPFTDIHGQRRLADLARADQGDSGLPTQCSTNTIASSTRDHPCKTKRKLSFCEDNP